MTLQRINSADRRPSCWRVHTQRVDPAPCQEIVRMKKPIRSVSLAAMCVLLASAPMAAFAYTRQELASGAKVSIEQARAIALKAAPGTIADEELENEPGGSGLRYSFDIKRGTKTYDVGVDAQTGAVIENKVEGPHPD